jgi:hypothetical protein
MIMKYKIILQLTLLYFILLPFNACVTEYDFNRTTPIRGTFGEEMYHVLHQDTQWSPRVPEIRRILLEREREAIITSLDQIIQADLANSLDLFLQSLAPLQDLEMIPDFTRKVASILDFTMDQSVVHTVLAHHRQRQGYKAFNIHTALLEYLVNWPQLESLLLYVSRIILANDGLNHEGYTNYSELATVHQLISLASYTLKTMELTQDPQRIEVVLGDIMLSSDHRFDSGHFGMWAVRTDPRGMPKLINNQSGLLHRPFIDLDGDGLPDLNEQGRFIDMNDQVIQEQAFGLLKENGLWLRDELTRAYIQEVGFVFDYVDLNQTALSFLIAQLPDLLEQDVIFNLLDALQVLLPDKVTIQSDGQYWSIYPTLNNSLVELLHASVYVLNIDILDELLDTASMIMRDHENLVAQILFALKDLQDRANNDSEAYLTAAHTLGDDFIEALIPIIGTPGLVEDLLIAMQDPVVQASAQPLADMLTYKAQRAVPQDQSPYNLCYYNCEDRYEHGTLDKLACIRACPNSEIMAELVDRNRPPSSDNRSHWERTLALFRTTVATSYELRVLTLEIPQLDINIDVNNTLPPLLRIDNVAAAYIHAVSGDFELINYVTEEAIASEDMDFLLDGLENICGSSTLDSLIQSLLPIMVNITPENLGHTCVRFAEVSDQTHLPAEQLKRHKLSVMVAFLSLLTDTSMDEKPSASQLTRFFNTPNPSLDLNIARLSLSQIKDQDGYLLWEHHGDMLYAAEASGLLDAMRPIFQVFVTHGMASELAQLMALLDQHYPSPQVVYFTQDGQAAPRAGQGSGLQRFEGILQAWLTEDLLFPALHQLAILGAHIQSQRKQSMNEILATFFRHVLVQDPSLSYRDGRKNHQRVDGIEIPTNRLFLLLDAFEVLSERLAIHPEAQAKWEHAAEALIDILLEVDQKETGLVSFVKKGSIALAQVIAENIANLIRSERDKGQFDRFIQNFYVSSENLLTGRGLPLWIDLYNACTNTIQDQELLRQLTHYLVDPVNQKAFLVVLYDLITNLRAESDLLIFGKFMGELIDPLRSWNAKFYPIPLISHIALLIKESLDRTPPAFIVSVIRNAFTRSVVSKQIHADPQGKYPFSILVETIADYNRVSPEVLGPLYTEDYQQFSYDVSRWLRDKKYGMEQIYDLIKSREKEDQ